jgi:Fe-S cluster assembly protein SufD
MNAKPELEIFADDVVCGHGATVSALDPEQVFYLQTRGIPTGEAEAILLEAFGQDAIERFGAPEMVPTLTGSLRTWLKTRKPQSTEASP